MQKIEIRDYIKNTQKDNVLKCKMCNRSDVTLHKCKDGTRMCDECIKIYNNK